MSGSAAARKVFPKSDFWDIDDPSSASSRTIFEASTSYQRREVVNWLLVAQRKRDARERREASDPSAITITSSVDDASVVPPSSGNTLFAIGVIAALIGAALCLTGTIFQSDILSIIGSVSVGVGLIAVALFVMDDGSSASLKP